MSKSKIKSLKTVEEVYDEVIKNKTAKEKLEMLNGLFKYAKTTNPQYFERQLNIWIKDQKNYENS